jgi:hypothetical protein
MSENLYPYVWAYAKFMRSDSIKPEDWVARATADNAPPDATFKADGRWHTIDEVTGPDTRAYLDKLVRERQQAA